MEPIVIEYMDPKHEGSGSMKPNVVKMRTRILRPSEYLGIRRYANPDYKALFDAALLTGMRVVELRLFIAHPEWFDGEFIHIPRIAIKKQKATVKQRWVHLSIKGRTVMENLNHNIRPDEVRTEQAIIKYLKSCAVKAEIGPYGINMKMFRKTYESWLISSCPNKKEEIFLSQGHDSLTALRHYVNLPFTEADKIDMKEWVEGWR
ncbi:MAG: site-specific integrase [Candidatus Thermoplasmatota archaeon]|jgi:integrase|nr:site-specific integrase [Candidatus Thermoplasmatota archaeon]